MRGPWGLAGFADSTCIMAADGASARSTAAQQTNTSLANEHIVAMHEHQHRQQLPDS